MTTVCLTGSKAPPPDWCSSQEQEEEWGWGGLWNWISVWCCQKWKSLTAGGWYSLMTKVDRNIAKVKSKVYLLRKCKSPAGDLKFHVKSFWNHCKSFAMGMGKKNKKVDIVNTGKTPLHMGQLKMIHIFLIILPYLAQKLTKIKRYNRIS